MNDPHLDPLLNHLAQAVEGAPEDTEVRALYAERLAASGRSDDAIAHALVVLSKQPTHVAALELVERLTAGLEGGRAGENSTGDAGTGLGTNSAYTAESRERRIIGHQPHGQGDGPIYESEHDWRQRLAELDARNSASGPATTKAAASTGSGSRTR